jgi:hypothetical protein
VPPRATDTSHHPPVRVTVAKTPRPNAGWSAAHARTAARACGSTATTRPSVSSTRPTSASTASARAAATGPSEDASASTASPRTGK